MVAATFQHLFGPPTPAAVRRMRNKKFYEGDIPNIRKSNKPLPGELCVFRFSCNLQGLTFIMLTVKTFRKNYWRKS